MEESADDEVQNVELFQQIKLEIFSQLGVKVSDLDPLFAMVIANQIAMRTFSKPVSDAIESLPSALEKSVEIIAAAVEEAENTTGKLVAETKSNMYALAKLELEGVHQRIGVAIEKSVDEALGKSVVRLKSELSAIEGKVKSVASSYRDKRAMTLCIALASGLVVLMSFFGVGLYMLYKAGDDNRKAADFWRDEYSQQQRIINTLPPALKKQFEINQKAG